MTEKDEPKDNSRNASAAVSPAAVRFATVDDAELILRFIKELAEYEKELEAVVATAEALRVDLAKDTPPFECLIAELDSQPVGMAFFFHNYSTWQAKQGIYLDDLYVTPECRGLGVGKQLLAELAKIAVERGCDRLDWQVLDWNEPSIKFYESLDAKIMRDWIPCRLQNEALRRIAATVS